MFQIRNLNYTDVSGLLFRYRNNLLLPLKPTLMKKCPYCAEEIQDAAIKCRFCGEMISDVHASAEYSAPLPIVQEAASKYTNINSWKKVLMVRCQNKAIQLNWRFDFVDVEFGEVICSMGGGQFNLNKHDLYLPSGSIYVKNEQGMLSATRILDAEGNFFGTFKGTVKKYRIEDPKGKTHIEADFGFNIFKSIDTTINSGGHTIATLKEIQLDKITSEIHSKNPKLDISEWCSVSGTGNKPYLIEIKSEISANDRKRLLAFMAMVRVFKAQDA